MTDGMASSAGISVLTVTHDRPERVRRLLASLERAAGGRIAQLLIVDDSASAPDYASEFPALPLEHVRLPVRQFISRAKNVGLAKVRNDLVLFIDDDNVVGPESFARAVPYLRGDPRLGAILPAVLYARRPDLVWVYATPFRPGRWGFELVGRDRPRSAELEGRFLPTDALPNAAFVRTSAARAVGGFDESLPVNSSAEFCRALKSAGWEVRADTGSFVYHDVEPPGTPGYWAAHASDRARVYYEMRDWFVFQRRLRAGERAVRWRALVHALPFVATTELAYWIRPGTDRGGLTVSLLRGVAAGLGRLPGRAGASGPGPPEAARR